MRRPAEQGSQVAVIYIDVDRFKQVNDKYGHKTGDLYLLQIAKRLSSGIRATDMLARIGGDEFLIVMPLNASADDSFAISARLSSCFRDPFMIEGNQLEGSASFGIAIYPENGLTADELKRHADYSMYLAKRSRAEDGGEKSDLTVITPAELSLALQRDQFSLAYQPQFSSEGRLDRHRSTASASRSDSGKADAGCFYLCCGALRSDL